MISQSGSNSRRTCFECATIDREASQSHMESVAEIKPQPQHQGLSYRQGQHQIAMLGHTESNPS